MTSQIPAGAMVGARAVDKHCTAACLSTALVGAVVEVHPRV